MTPLSGRYCETSVSVLFILVIMLSASCDSPPIDPSSSTDSLLVAVLSDLYLEEADIQLAAAAQSDSARTARAQDGLETGRRDSIIAAHSLTEVSFHRYMAPYLSRPHELQMLYDRVLDRLNLERQQVQAQ